MRAAWYCALALVVLLGSPAAWADTVSGYVLDVATDQRLAEVEVAFLIAGENGLSEMVRHSTDADGRFSFSGPFLTEGVTFGLVAHYEGLEYATDVMEVGGQDQIIIEVYDGTEDESDLRIDGHHLFLTVTAVGIDVAQLIHVDNLAAATYVGQAIGSGGGERRVFRAAVPPRHQSLQPHSGQVLHGTSGELFTSSPLPPGRTQIAFTLQVSGDDFDGTYEHRVLYPTQRLELFLQPADIDLPDVLFEDLGEIQLHDQGYRHYRVQGLSPGRTVSIPLPFSQPVRWALKWGVLVLVLALVAAAISLTRPTGLAQHTDAGQAAEEVESQRLELLRELARIDAALETSSGPQAETLQRQRDALMTRLRVLYAGLPGR